MRLDPSKVDRVVIHTAAAAHEIAENVLREVDQPYQVVRDYHVNTKGWADFGYHEYVRKDGQRYDGRPLSVMGAQLGGYNSRSVGICMSGHGDVAPPTPEQWKSTVNAAVDMLKYFRLIERFKKNPMVVIGHREINRLIDAKAAPGAERTFKTCPGTKVDMSKFRRDCLAEVQRRKL